MYVNINRNAWMSILWIGISVVMIVENGFWGGSFIYVAGAIYFSALWVVGMLQEKGINCKADQTSYGLLLTGIWLISITVIGGLMEKLNKTSLMICSGLVVVLCAIFIWHIIRYRKNKER